MLAPGPNSQHSIRSNEYGCTSFGIATRDAAEVADGSFTEIRTEQGCFRSTPKSLTSWDLRVHAPLYQLSIS